MASEHILKVIESYGDKVAQIDAETRRKITFAEIKQKSVTLGKWLNAHNLGRGSTICFMNPNNVDFGWILLGVWSSGAACYLLNPKYTVREVQHVFSTTRVDCLIIPKGGFQRFSESCKVQLVLEFGDENTHCSKGAVAMEEVFSSQPIRIEGGTKKSPNEKKNHSKDDLALIMTSSGSTGPPKGVMITHGNVLANLSLSGRYLAKNATALGLMPYYHAYGLITMLMCLLEGVLIVNLSSFSLSSWIDTIREYSVSHMHIVPSLSLSLLKSDTINFNDLRSVRYIWLAAAPVSDKAHMELIQKFHQTVEIHIGYGLTETTCLVVEGTLNPQKPGSLGKVVETMELKIIDKESGSTLPPSSLGEVCIRGPMVMKGYLNNPKATSEAIDKDGWIKTGDLGYLDAEGYFYYVDRIKHIIKYQGHQISPSELEAILISHPGVKEAVVVGAPHEIFGELPRAFIVRSENSNITAQDIHSFMKDMVAPNKRLRGGVIFVESLPKIGPGKFDKTLLRTMKPETVFYDNNTE